ncbi:peptidase s8 and s53 subtilisin kexin sedolisin [Leptolyngbya sp. Heron Island J]|uniref:S8 family serine peptidase n=1 Tax=Leptolyngbya sp. Heron Island J TaxID=1385935 RepID=UPI0003B9BC81|nr:S8 family serine peptidase [Leptolyngbya sp. Heron Island J]ESA34059.1 peptidase s8 and s53 subtilisin kexin sedolisin [Leptolyngbya sp. Heron Island J]
MLEQPLLDSNFDQTSLDSLQSTVNTGSDLELTTHPSGVSALNEIGLDEGLLAHWENSDSLSMDSLAFADTLTIAEPLPISVSASTAADSLTGDVVGTFSTDNSWSQSTTSPSYLYGSLRADRFQVDLSQSLTVISGNGNVDYGRGLWDVLDLSNISTQSVIGWSPVESGGVLFDTGNGARVFDSLQLSNGSQILFEGLDSIQFADGAIDLSVDPNDSGFSSQWNLHMMGVHNAWRFTQGNSNVLVGVQDSGLGYNPYAGGFHPDLNAANMVYFSNNVVDEFFRSGSGPRLNSHGTGVQSIISAATNNGYGMSGINWNSTVFSIDVLDNNVGDMSLVQATQEMINYANSQGQRLVINMSLSSSGLNQGLEQLIATNQNNALFVIAAGNDNRHGISQPAALGQNYANVIAVGASWGTQDRFGNLTNPGDRISYLGGWGSNYGAGLSLMGPSEVLAARANSPSAGGTFDFESLFNGTSAAAPNVAGVASLVWSANPYLSATQVHQIMAETAFDLGPAGYDIGSGFGFVNADAAVRRALAIAVTSGSTPSAQTSFMAELAEVIDFLSPAKTEALGTAEPAVAEMDWAAIVAGLVEQFTTPALQNNFGGNEDLGDAILTFSTESTVGLVEHTIDRSWAQRSTAEVTREHAQALEEFVAQLSLSDVLTPEFDFVA